MRGLNKVLLIGNLGSDPELQTLDGNIKLAKFSLATSETYKDAQGKTQTSTEWHQILAWKNLAELAQNYLHKGSKVYIEGKIKTRNFVDKEGNKKYVTEIIADTILMLDKAE